MQLMDFAQLSFWQFSSSEKFKKNLTEFQEHMVTAIRKILRTSFKKNEPL
jgi:hypothetical protein